MRRGTASPFGARLRRPTTIKVKGLNIVPKASDIAAATDGTGWGKMWANWDWSGWIKPQVDLAIANGANLVKITGSGATADYPTTSTFHTRITQLFDYCLANGLRVYWNYASSDWGGSVAAATTPLQTIAAFVGSYPQVVALDVGNEVGGSGFMTVDAAQALIPIAQAACNLPCTASVLCQNVGDFTGSTMEAIALAGANFLDPHPYFGDSADPSDSDLASLRAQSWFKPYLIGECGQRVSAGSPAMTSRWTAIGAMSAASGCYGAVGFSITDYATEQWGMYAADLTTARTAVTAPFAAWPAAA